MVKAILASFIVIITFNNVLAKDLKIVIGYEDNFAPFSFKDKQGVPRGEYFKVLGPILNSLSKYNITYEALSWKRLEESSRGESAFIGVGFYKRTVARPWIKHYSKPFYIDKNVLYCQKKSMQGKSVNNFPADVAGLKIGMVRGYETGGDEFKKMAKKGEFKLVEYTTNGELIKDLLLSSVDCTINSMAAIDHQIKEFYLNVDKKAYPKSLEERLSTDLAVVFNFQDEAVHLIIGEKAAEKFPELLKFLEDINKKL